jgi:hypothetical protein
MSHNKTPFGEEFSSSDGALISVYENREPHL